MLQSELFTKTKKEAPKDEEAVNAKLLIRAGFIHKEMAGVYAFLPLGLRVINKISDIIREEMDKIGGVEMQSTALQKQDIWEKTNRWDDKSVDNWFKTELKNGTKLGLAFTHEEPMSNMLKSFVSSYKDLPVYVYDIRTVFRNEARAKSGIIRGREFFWKALYSFSKNEAEHNAYYEKAKIAYRNIFDRAGLGEKTFLTFAAGGSFSKYSHEFQTVCDAGEDTIYVDEEKNTAINKEVYTDETLNDIGLEKSKLIEKKAIETGNIFSLGYKFSEPLNLKYKDENGKEQPVFMGCYGIGISRLMGVIAEIYNDEKGLIWPESVAPFQVHLLEISGEKSGVEKSAEETYSALRKAGIEVLYDDRKSVMAGEKFSDADLIGIPWRAVVSERTKGKIEVKKRNEEKAELLNLEDFIKSVKDKK
jgi:prolyl-tRNA synthetase